MKVVHICTEIAYGGAARATLNLHLGLRRLGIESTVLSLGDSHQLPHCKNYSGSHLCGHKQSAMRGTFLKEVSRILAWRNRTELSNSHFSIDLFGCQVSDLPLVQEADIINLHWTAEFLSSVSIAELATLGKPLVWTLHDMRPLTGGCHFSAGCNRFMETCGKCPQLREEPAGYTSQNLLAMTAAVTAARLVFVAPSKWMLQNAQRSCISKDLESHCIPYGVDIERFTPLAKDACRAQLGIQPDVCCILFAVHGFHELRKGIGHALAVFETIRRAPVTARDVANGRIRILCCGADADRFQPPGWQVERFGYLQAEKMPWIYNSADALLFTSLEDNLPNVVLEAMACGVPVVAHRVGGVPDLIEEESNCLFDIGNTTGVATSLIEILRNKRLCHQSVERMKKCYSLEKQARRYWELYRDLTVQKKELPIPLTHLREGSSEALFFTLPKLKRGHEVWKGAWKKRITKFFSSKKEMLVKRLLIQETRSIPKEPNRSSRDGYFNAE